MQRFETHHIKAVGWRRERGGNKRATTTRDGKSEREVELTWAGAVWASRERPRGRSVGDGQSMTASRRIASQIPGASSNRPERAEPQVEAGKGRARGNQLLITGDRAGARYAPRCWIAHQASVAA